MESEFPFEKDIAYHLLSIPNTGLQTINYYALKNHAAI